MVITVWFFFSPQEFQRIKMNYSFVICIKLQSESAGFFFWVEFYFVNFNQYFITLKVLYFFPILKIILKLIKINYRSYLVDLTSGLYKAVTEVGSSRKTNRLFNFVIFSPSSINYFVTFCSMNCSLIVYGA